MWNVVNFMADEVRIFLGVVLLNGDPGGFVFFEADCQERGLKFSLGDATFIETMVW